MTKFLTTMAILLTTATLMTTVIPLTIATLMTTSQTALQSKTKVSHSRRMTVVKTRKMIMMIRNPSLAMMLTPVKSLKLRSAVKHNAHVMQTLEKELTEST